MVREAGNSDVADIVRVIRAVYDEFGFPWEEEGYHADLYDIEASYNAHGDKFYVAEWDGQVVGTGALELFERLEGTDGVTKRDGYIRVAGADCSIERLYVHADGRRRGVGRAVMQRVIAGARDAGRKRMEIWSDKRFNDAHRLYEKLGARIVGERLCDDPELSPEFGLALDLTDGYPAASTLLGDEGKIPLSS